MKNFFFDLVIIVAVAGCSSARVMPTFQSEAASSPMVQARSVRIETRRQISAEEIFVEDDADEIVYPNMMTAR